MNKKAQINGLVPIITTLVIIGLLLGVGFLVLQSFIDTQGDTASSVTATTNETRTLTVAGVYAAANVTADNCFNSFTITSLYNSTVLLTNGANYTYEPATGKIFLVAADTLNTGPVNFTYTYKYSTAESCSALANTTDAINKIPTWLIIIVVLAIVGIVLGIVFNVMPSMSRGSEVIAEV